MASRELTAGQTLADTSANPRLRPGRAITGMSAVLLPFQADRSVDWKGFSAHIMWTFEAGLVPAVNMDTGYASLIEESTRTQALEMAQELAAGRRYVAGAFVGDEVGNNFQADAYHRQIDQIGEFSGTPVVMQSHGLVDQENAAIVESYHLISEWSDEFIAFELGQRFEILTVLDSLTALRGASDLFTYLPISAVYGQQRRNCHNS